MSHIAVSLLGPFTVQVDGLPAPQLGYDKARALPAYLAAERAHPQRREHLTGLLWPDTPEPGALPLLSHALLETCRRREGRMLTLRGYAEAGGVSGAIAHSGEVQRWHIDPAWWRERAGALAGRNLTQAEWAQYRIGEPYRATCAEWPAGE